MVTNTGDASNEPVMPRGMGFLRWLLDYELCGAKRYRRFTTLLMVSSAEAEADFELLLRNMMRGSDEFIRQEGSDLAILMPETDSNGALIAINRANRYHGEQLDLRFSVASYPTDGSNSGELLDAAQHRLDIAKRGSPGTIVNHH